MAAESLTPLYPTLTAGGNAAAKEEGSRCLLNTDAAILDTLMRGSISAPQNLNCRLGISLNVVYALHLLMRLWHHQPSHKSTPKPIHGDLRGFQPHLSLCYTSPFKKFVHWFIFFLSPVTIIYSTAYISPWGVSKVLLNWVIYFY